MNKDNYIGLIYKKLKGGISLEEQSILDIWVGQSEENERLMKETVQNWELTATYESQVDLELDIEGDFQFLQQRIQKEELAATLTPVAKDNLKVAHQPIGKVVTMNSKKSANTWIGWAAAAAVAMAVGFWFVNGENSIEINQVALETKYNQEKAVTLADGTKVYLNGQSKLEYPTTFEGNQRLVKLTGEAFFDVARNAQKPFIIETSKAKVTVLGTSFNVRARLVETATEVVVKTGKVRFENTVGDRKVELTPNEKGIYNSATNTINETPIATMNDLAWHTDVFVYKGTTLQEVTQDIAKQFNVEINLANPAMKTCKLSGRYDAGKGVQYILESIAEGLEMESKAIGNTAYELIGGKCK